MASEPFHRQCLSRTATQSLACVLFGGDPEAPITARGTATPLTTFFPALSVSWGYHGLRTGAHGQEDPLEKEMATHSSILTWRIPMDRGAWHATVYGVAESRTRLSD